MARGPRQPLAGGGSADDADEASRRGYRRPSCRRGLATTACLVLLALSWTSASSAAEIDSDLVFDDPLNADVSDHHRPHHDQLHVINATHPKKSVDPSVVSPVASPIEDLPTTPTSDRSNDGILFKLHSFGKRLKRELLSLLSGNKESGSAENISTESIESVPAVEDIDLSLSRSRRQSKDYTDEYEEGSDPVNELPPKRTPLRPSGRGDTDDDEDDILGSGLPGPDGGGSGGRQIYDVASPYYFRITVTIHEPFQVDLTSRESALYKQISTDLAEAVAELFRDYPGRQEATVINIQKTDNLFFSKVTFDLASQGNDDVTAIREKIRSQIDSQRRLGSLEANLENFSFRSFGKSAQPPPSCNGVSCRSGECLPHDARCNGRPECADGSDELGCPIEDILVNTTSVVKPPVESVPTVDAEDRCRADDKVRCADGTVFICTVQVCDGSPDCPGGTEEVDCPNDCAEGELMCDVTRCVPAHAHCNGVPDCSDGTDETGCRAPEPPQPACNSDNYRCKSGQCIDYYRRCDDIVDCPDGDDEAGCNQTELSGVECQSHEFTCDDGSCIDARRKCDGRGDCTDLSDETNCPEQEACSTSEYQCDFGTCIPRSKRCDGRRDCPDDDSDERNCHGGCAANEFQCRSDRTCIPTSLRCNRQVDCSDSSDEEFCGPMTCRSDQFRCDDGLCLNINQRCNGINECYQEEDEVGCDNLVAPCPSTDFSCPDGSCIPLAQKCDRKADCPDGSDEAGCPGDLGDNCGPGEFRCADGGCITDSLRCDKIPDCVDHSDEAGCPAANATVPVRCTSTDIQCGDGTCVDASRRCDRVFDCLDGVDERDCELCSPGQFRCEDGECLAPEKRCNDRSDCRDGSDELDCVSCPGDKFQCGDRTCVEARARCNGHFECLDRTDEDGCPTGGASVSECGPREFKCADGPCITEAFKCDGFDDCVDKSDEQNCPRKPCTEREFACVDDGSCIDGRARCDGRDDCRDASDEVNCGCQPGEFTCLSGDCVPEDQRCNRRLDCLDGSDERNCPVPTPAPRPSPVQPPVDRCAGQFACRSGGQCVPLSARCNDRVECQDFSDEDSCGGTPGGLNLKTYPNDQIIKEIAKDREVVFQCRDEGPLRARVRWVRGNGQQLPPGSRDVAGRLEIPDIQVEHSGTYMCEAVGYPRTTPGASVTVTLQVDKSAPPPIRPPTACGLQEATCVNGECISKQYVCDGKFDCSDGSDEMRCSPQGCEPNQFRCANKKCVLKTWRCDSEDDCGDNSDEQSCATNPPGSACLYHEFQCQTGAQCVPRSFHCDLERDCVDGSDEVGCSPVHIQTPPPPMVVLDIGEVFTITCTAVGIPTPEISWRLNWGHIPPKCTTTSVNGVGVLTCLDIQESDQGAYSCEAINNRGSKIGVPDTILMINKHQTTCPRSTFNSEARSLDECIACFCFGVATECNSADLFTYQLPPPFDQYKLVTVNVPRGNALLSIRPDYTFGGQQPNIRPIARQGFHVVGRSAEREDPYNVPFFVMPENYHGNQLKSYGGYLKYTVRYEGSGRPVAAPDVILSGNGYTLVHTARVPLTAGRDNEVTVRFFFGQWQKRGENSGDGGLASREEIMMALGAVDNILIKSQYIGGNSLDTTITSIRMDSAGVRNTDQGLATFVEECRCPAGYSGLSCESCASGFSRHRSGPWLGLCSPVDVSCPAGKYGDPSRNVPCQDCPCPLTNPGNQFGRTCQLDTDGQVTCNCPPGYVGRRCEQCTAGYQGNPLVPGDFCRPAGACNEAGSLSVNPDSSGQCRCKTYASGPTCNQCQPNTFNLDGGNQFGCISCFCMGITQSCTSSNWYRNQVSSSFVRDTQDFKLLENSNQKEPITEGIRLNANDREITFQDFSRGSPDAYYWQLPTQFLGDKITSYGGVLNYTIRYVPAPGGQSSRNNAADVELVSSNSVRLMYFGRGAIEPNRAQTVSVPLLEQYWQRQDGQAANREHMLMALADVDAILIKATYTTNTREAALMHVSLDVAEERNTNQVRASAVEQCLCPVGYKGLSCHDCDVGYTRAEEGLYLGLCELCSCNGHSGECHPDTGVCLNCRDNTEGPNCETCATGYNGDATQGRPDDCRREEAPTPNPQCDCNKAGVQHCERSSGQCQCKTNVEGRRCDACRRGCYDLSERHPGGCLECFCSGVTEICQSSTLYRTQIPMQIIDSRHGFTLTDSSRNEVTRDGFELDESMNEIRYTFTDVRSPRLFWSLPPMFTGNKVTSYGGNLTVTQKFSARQGTAATRDQDVVIIGNGVTLFWTNPQPLQPNRQTTFSVPLFESGWTHLDTSGPRPASRADLLTALAGVEALLIRATHGAPTQTTYLSDVSLDTAVQQYTGQEQATDVEACRCPPEYRGSSCESCASGHYRDAVDRSQSVAGACKRCPCNGNEESCNTTPGGRGVTCNCLPGYKGRWCDDSDSSTARPEPPRTPAPPTITVAISEPIIQIVDIGSTVRYRCQGQSIVTQKPVSIQWSKEGGVLPRDRAIDDRRGLLVITDVRVSDSGTYICSANDGVSVVTERAVLTVGGSAETAPRVTIEPRYVTTNEGEPFEFRCTSTGNPAPSLRWVSTDGRQLNAQSTFTDGVFRVPAVRKSDEGIYECVARNPAGTDTRQATLYVRERAYQPPVVETPVVSPQEYSGPGGEETIRFSCQVGSQWTTRWTRAGGRELPSSAVQRDGTLTIYNASPSDSGIYVCTATSSTTGQVETVEARVTIVSFRGPPTVRIEPERQTVSQGTTAELRCLAAGDPAPRVRWTKVGEELGRSVQQITEATGHLLRISNVQVNDRGVYVCFAENDGGTAQASAIMEVERREPPSIELYPESRQTVTLGGSALLQCRVTSGTPQPTLRWSRPDGRSLSPNVEDLEGGVLRFQRVTSADAGQYTCHAENGAGSVTAVATLEIQSPPTITLVPSRTVTVSVGQRVRLECRTAGEPAPSVSWTKYRAGQTTYDDRRRIQPETKQSAVFEITAAAKSDEGTYICRAHNTAGELEERLQLIVNDGNTGIGNRGDIPVDADSNEDNNQDSEYERRRQEVIEREIDRQRQREPRPTSPNTFPPSRGHQAGGAIVADQEVFRVPVGGDAEMRCRVRGNREEIFLTWIRTDKQPLPAGYRIDDGVLYIRNVDASAAGEYSCLGVSVPTRSTLFTASTRLEVIAPPRIQLNPSRQVVRPGDHAHITCSATGDQPINIQWSALGRAFSSRATVVGGHLQFRGIEVSDAGRYVCKATNSAGETEGAAEVVVNEHQTAPSAAPATREQLAQAGSTVTLRCQVADERARVQWSRDGAQLPRAANVRGSVLEIVNVQREDQGRYVCEVRNHDGTSSDYINLRVDPLPTPTTAVRIEPSQQVVRLGDTLDVKCIVSGQSSSSAQISWSKGSEPLDHNAQAYGNLLRISDIRPNNGGVYTCSVRTLTGSFAEDYSLAIQDADVVSSDPAPVETRSAPHGSLIVMDCRTDLEAPVTYVWSKQGGMLPKDSNTDQATLTLHDVRAADAGTYVCSAQNGAVKMDIPTVLTVTGVVPHFAQAPLSYLALPTLPDAYLVFAIEISFKPEAGDGLLLYNGQQRGGGGDFVSLGLNGSYLEFRFNVGSGPALIRSTRPITLGEWHTVKLHRTRKEGMMYVDGDGPVKGTALGRFQGLDLLEPLYVGGVPNFNDLHRLNGHAKGFVGCISRLLIGSVDHDLVRDATLTHGVTNCETCAVNQCRNRGVCQEANRPQGYACICPSAFSGANCERVGLACYPGACGPGRCVNRPTEGYDCFCPFGRGGDKCQDEIGISEPAFADDANAYLAYPTPKAAIKRLKMALKINPKTTEDGILLYCSQSDEGHGDFASLAIRDKRLEFRFDTGSGPAVLRSDRDIVPGQWVTVTASRDFQQGHLSINDDAPISGRSPGDKRGLNLRTPLYVGGYDKHKVTPAVGVGVSKGFHGCVAEIKLAGLEMDMFASLEDSANVQDCSAVNGGGDDSSCDHSPCANGGRCVAGMQGQYTCHCAKGYSGRDCETASDICQSQRPCQNGGTCIGTATSFACRCSLGYSGDTCQNIADLGKDVSFSGDGYVELRHSLLPHRDSAEHEVITVDFTSTEADGLIFWQGQEASADGKGQDFLSLAVVEGILEFSYELGSGPAMIRAAGKRVDDGRRHRVLLKRQGSDGSIELDNEITEFGMSAGFLHTLNTRGNIFIGGVVDFERMTAGRYSRGFTGCVHRLHFQGAEISIGDNAVAGVNVQPCSSAGGENDDVDNDILNLGEIVN